MAFTFSPSTGRYRVADSGRLVSESAVRAEIDRLADAASGRLAVLTERLRAGDVTLADWQSQALGVIKQGHVAAGMIAQGGKAQMTPSAFGFLGHQIRGEYGHLRDLANGIADGSVPLDGRLVARAGMYGQAARTTYETVRARHAAGRGFTEEKNTLHASESCTQCSDLSRQDWVPLGTLPPIGSRTCLTRCRCTISRRRTEPALRLVS